MASVNRAKDLSAIALSSDPVWARTIPRRPVDQTLVSVGVAWRRASSQGPGNRPFAPPPATRRAGPEGPDSARFRRTRPSWRRSEHGAGRYHEQVRQATPRDRVVSSRSTDIAPHGRIEYERYVLGTGSCLILHRKSLSSRLPGRLLSGYKHHPSIRPRRWKGT